MGDNPQAGIAGQPDKPVTPIAAAMWAAVLFFFGVGMVMYPSREFTQGRIGDLESLILFLLWSRPGGVLCIILGLYCGWRLIDSRRQEQLRLLGVAAMSSAFGAFFGRIGFSGQGFAPSAFRGAALVSLLAFVGVLLSRITIFPVFAALERLWKRRRGAGSRTAGNTSGISPAVGVAPEEQVRRFRPADNEVPSDEIRRKEVTENDAT